MADVGVSLKRLVFGNPMEKHTRNDFIFLYYCIILISTAKSFKIKIEVNFLYAFCPGLGDSMQGLGFRQGLGLGL